VGWLAGGLRWLLERSRPGFHPAVIATWQVVVYFILFSAIGTPLVWLIGFLGPERYVVNYEFMGLMGGVLIIAELVRGLVKAWLGKRPDEWSFPAIAVAGAAAGAAFQGYMALSWGYDSLVEFGVTTAVGSGFWVCMALCLVWEERKKRRQAATSPPPTG
jgi:hypothetical protein